tara:strand:- start:1755 stop:2486 length:732 start_codon:yes stop_codon:yes gene_type:complete
MKKRIDHLLVDEKWVESRQRAQRLILAGKVLVNDVPVTKAGQLVDVDSVIRLKENDHPYVSRGALKLKKAIETFSLDVKNQIAMDVGASTGGFTEVLLENGIKKVFAVDVGTNQLHWKIRNHSQVEVFEGTNARHLPSDFLTEKLDWVVMDVSFISIRKIIPQLIPLMKDSSQMVTLIKPQFEIGREKVGKGGVVRSESDQNEIVEEVSKFIESLGFVREGLVESPIKGAQGNREFLAYWKRK